MAVNISHAPKPVVQIAPPSDTPIFDQLLRDFFKDRKDTYPDLCGRRMDPEPVYQFADDPANQIINPVPVTWTHTPDYVADETITRPMRRIGLSEEHKKMEEAYRPFRLVPDIQE